MECSTEVGSAAPQKRRNFSVVFFILQSVKGFWYILSAVKALFGRIKLTIILSSSGGIASLKDAPKRRIYGKQTASCRFVA